MLERGRDECRPDRSAAAYRDDPQRPIVGDADAMGAVGRRDDHIGFDPFEDGRPGQSHRLRGEVLCRLLADQFPNLRRVAGRAGDPFPLRGNGVRGAGRHAEQAKAHGYQARQISRTGLR